MKLALVLDSNNVVLEVLEDMSQRYIDIPARYKVYEVELENEERPAIYQDKMITVDSVNKFQRLAEKDYLPQYWTEKEKRDVEEAKNNRIDELQDYLNATDYVIAKLQELYLTDLVEYESEKTKYEDTLKKRKAARKELDSLK